MKTNSVSHEEDQESNDISEMEQYRPKLLSSRQTYFNLRDKKIIFGLISLILILWWYFTPGSSPSSGPAKPFPFQDPYSTLTKASNITTLQPSVLQEILAI
jgi:hypothetical protein